MSQNMAILNYLAERHPQARLTGEDARGRAIVNRWLGYINSDVHKAFSPLMHQERLLLGDQAAQQRPLGAAKATLHRHFAVLGHQLRQHDWIADPNLFVLTHWARDRAWICVDGTITLPLRQGYASNRMLPEMRHAGTRCRITTAAPANSEATLCFQLRQCYGSSDNLEGLDGVHAHFARMQ